MRKLNLFRYGLTALMMAFAMTLCFSCSSDDDEEVPEEKKEYREDNPSSKSKGSINGHAYVELASIKWATENVGVANGVAAKAGPNDERNYWGCYYYTQNGAIRAAASWGGTWELPSIEQWKKLADECYWEWTNNYNEKTGYIVYKAKKDDDKGKCNKEYSNYSLSADLHIFLPAAGLYHADSRYCNGQMHWGFYWSTDDSRYCSFYNEYAGVYDYNHDDPLNGMSVRLVSE